MRRLFEEARALSDTERARLIAESGADERTRRHVLEMLEVLDEHPEFLSTPLLEANDVDRALERASAEERPAPDHVGGYTIVRRIGAGGMGTVYEAIQTSPRRSVALKVLRDALTSERARARFELEAEALGRLRHPGIAQIHEAGTADTPLGPRPYIAMELIEGEPIDRSLRGAALERRVDALADVCDGVHHAHQRGVVHRDIKAANVLVDADGRPRVVDFGIALISGETAPGDLAGSLGAMSPERLGDARTDTGVDVYALGVLAYELLGGAPAHDLRGLDLREAAELIRTTTPEPLGRLDPRLRGDLEAIVARAMAPDPERRYQSAAQLADDLRRWRRHEAVSVRAPTLGYLASRLVRRHRVASVAIGVAAVALVAGSAGTTAALVWALDQRARTSAALADAEHLIESLEAFLTSPDPRVRGRDARVADLLAGAERALEQDYRDSPRIGARLGHTIGATYRALGDLDRARALLEDALAVRRRELGDADPRTLATMDALARTLSDLAQYATAEPLAREALEGRRRVLGPRDRDTLSSMHTLGLLLEREGRYDDSAALLRSLRTTGAEALGERDALVLTADNCLANIDAQRGRLERARDLHARTLEARRETLGEDHPDTLQSRNNLAAVLSNLGDNETAVRMLEDAVATERAVLGEEHHETLQGQSNLAAVYRRLGRDDRALELMTRTLRTRRETLGDTHAETIISVGNLAALHARRGEAAEAERLFAQAVGSARVGLGEDHPTLALLRLAHARTLATLGRHEEALASLGAAWGVLETMDGDAARQCAQAGLEASLAAADQEAAERWRGRLEGLSGP